MVDLGICDKKIHDMPSRRQFDPWQASVTFKRNECSKYSRKQRKICNKKKFDPSPKGDIKKVKRINKKAHPPIQVKGELLNGKRQLGLRRVEKEFPKSGFTYEKILYAKTAFRTGERR